MAQELWFSVVDVRGVRALGTPSSRDPSSVDIELPAGERLSVPRARVHSSWDGSYTFEDAFEDCVQNVAGGQIAIPVVAEQAEIEKRSVERERVRLTTSVATHDEMIDVPTMEEELVVERVAVGRVVEHAAPPRQVGDTLIVPVYEEKAVVVKQLVLKEEIHVTRKRHERNEQQQVTLRREQVSVQPVRTDDTPAREL